MPSGSSERMTSLTSWPTKGRASTLLSFLTTEAAPSRSAGTSTPRPASSPSVATSTSATRSLRPGMPSQRAASARRPVPSALSASVTALAVVGSATSPRSKGGAVRSAGRSWPRVSAASTASAPLAAGPALPGTGSPSAPASSSSSRRDQTVFISKRSKVAAAWARSQAPSVRWVDVDVERHVAHERDDARVGARQLLVLGQVLAQLRRLLVEVGENPVEVAVLGQQLGRGLLPHARNAGQVVRRVAAQRGQQHVLRRRHPAALEDARLVVERVVADAALVVEHAHPGVLHELEAVAVARDDDHLGLALDRLGGQRGQDVVGLEARRLDHRDGQRLHDLADHVELRWQQPRRLRPARLVVLEDLVAEGGPGGVEGHRQRGGSLLPDEVHQHGGEAVHGVGDHAGRGGQRVGQRVVGPEGQRHAIEQQQGAGALLLLGRRRRRGRSRRRGHAVDTRGSACRRRPVAPRRA